MGLVDLVLYMIDPFFIMRRFFLWPVLGIYKRFFNFFYSKIEGPLKFVKSSVVNASVVGGFVIGAVIGAILLYSVFNMIYMPAIAHMRPVNMQFKACKETAGQCSFPQAHVTLNEKQRLLMQGQEYKVAIQIDMPESPKNRDLGMFMVCSELRDSDYFVRADTCRSAMLEYKSPSIRAIQKLITLPMILVGLMEENQSVAVEVFPKYIENVDHPITEVYVEIQSHNIEFYKVTLHITANFSGLRYLIHNFPLLSAAFGITSNFVMLLVSAFAVWYFIPMYFVKVIDGAMGALKNPKKKAIQEDITPNCLKGDGKLALEREANNNVSTDLCKKEN